MNNDRAQVSKYLFVYDSKLFFTQQHGIDTEPTEYPHPRQTCSCSKPNPSHTHKKLASVGFEPTTKRL